MRTTTIPRALTIAVITLSCALLGAPSATAQVERVVDPDWTMPRTADGQPDLQGLWGTRPSRRWNVRRRLQQKPS